MNSDAGDGACPIWVDGDLFIRFLYLDVTGKNYAITGNGSNGIDFGETVLNATTTTGNSGALCDFAKATFYSRDAYLTTGSFNASKKAVCDSNGTPLSNVKTDASLFVDGVIVGVGYSSTMGVYPSGLNAGSISYSYSTNTLTLDGVDIACSSRFIDNKKLEGLTIAVKGTNTVNNATSWSIFSAKSFTVKGVNETYASDQLTVSDSFGALCLWPNTDSDNNVMTLKDVTLDLKGSNVGISFSSNSGTNYTGSLVIDKCKVTSELTGTSTRSSIRGFESCTLTRCGVNTASTPIYYNSAQKSFTDINGESAKKVVIGVPNLTYTNISVLGTPVTNLNASNILVDGLTSGSISYRHDYRRLTLAGVTLTAPEGNTAAGVKITADDFFYIALDGANTMTTSGTTISTNSDAAVTMTGSGSFTGESTTASGLSMDGGSNFTINVDGTVRLTGKERGIWGNGYNNSASTVTLKKYSASSDYYFKGTDNGAVVNVADLILDGMDFYYSSNYGTPGCYFEERYVRQNGGDVVKGDRDVNFYGIGKSYGISIAGTPVTDCNERAVGSKYITGGGPKAVSYDITSNTLTLDNATIRYEGDSQSLYGIVNDGVDGLNIQLVGDNTINTTGYVALHTTGGKTDAPVTTRIVGDGKLQCQSSWIAVWVSIYNTLDIGGNVEVTAEGSTSPGIGSNMSGSFNETLIIRDNAKVQAKGRYGSVNRLNDIQLLDGIKLLKPAGAEITKGEWGWCVSIDGEPTDEWVVFGKGIRGDVNGDGSVNVADIACIIDVMAGSADVSSALADVNGDGTPNVADIGEVIDIMAASARKMKNEE